ncbi:ATP-dependent helicase [Leucobacter weissii]|uniref:DNA 3'-5' helicase n=1 Tax=Leucobacter weissii TaxID=1983706 RepID=A0A939MQF3_9MICO|nr:ATP-dependent DNA helicase [Leucobacter weissii]MBO1901144.1 ATP-dependent helicase [Leucobacter weissii]
MTAVFSAVRIAELLAEPPRSALVPTSEQRAVIEHPLQGSALIVAGAGSGKTETMAARVVWLVANGLVAPDQVLGLTFTRKAAGELRERIVGRLEAFGARLADAAERGRLTSAEAARATALVDLLSDGLDLPEVSTYNSFAAGVLQEFGVSAGLLPGATMIDEATAWRIAREVILASGDPGLASSGLRIPELVRQVIGMDHAVADHLTTLDRVQAIVTEFSRVIDLPYDEKDPVGGPAGKNYAAVRDAVANVSETPLIARLAGEFAEEKRRRGLIEFSDQLVLAVRALEHSTDAAEVLRGRHRAVLLDEVQDTSVGQTRLLSRIFAGAPVMAVGDPHQSIYGWRGASAAGLRSFHADFRAPGSEHRAATLTLSTSWRNPETVLEAANVISAPLAADSVIDVPRLRPRTGAPQGTVEWIFPETVHEEREQVAAWVSRAREAHEAEHGALPTAAVIFRNRRHMAAFSAVLAQAGVPNRIVGLGGLLSTPEITDVVSALRCLWYADAGGELIRLLVGPRFRVGVADIAGLRDAARWFEARDVSQKRLGDEDREADRMLPDPDRQFTLVDALDQFVAVRDVEHPAFAGISPVGRERLRDAGLMLRSLRQGVAGDIVELIWAVVRALRIDIELEANEHRWAEAGAVAMTNLDVFVELVEKHLAIDAHGTLPSLLEWIERAVEADETAEHVAAPVPGTVHLITAHGSKGLEWDIVAVPRLVEAEFPATPRDGTGWLRKGQLPDELRADAAARPVLDWRIATTQKELRGRLTDYRNELKERYAAEERRLAYVAVTRSAGRLLLSGSFWGGQSRPRKPSPYLRELAGHAQQERPREESAGNGHGRVERPLDRPLSAALPEESRHDDDPSRTDEYTMQWPLDPLGVRAAAVRRAAAAVRTAIASADAEPVDPTVGLLLAEREAARRGDGETVLAERITASSFHEFVENPAWAERHRLRPVPQRPYRRTRTGNRFHEWVERRATTGIGTALVLPGLEPGAVDPEREEFDVHRDLEPLIQRFEASRWADRKPIAVELEIALPFAGRTLVCKLDAVYRDGDGPEARYEVVDWKSGRPPRDDAERSSRFLQLDLYRQAYARWSGISPEKIDVTLFYVAEGEELRGEGNRSLEELEGLWRGSAQAVGFDAADPADGE